MAGSSLFSSLTCSVGLHSDQDEFSPDIQTMNFHIKTLPKLFGFSYVIRQFGDPEFMFLRQ